MRRDRVKGKSASITYLNFSNVKGFGDQKNIVKYNERQCYFENVPLLATQQA
jgi:nitrogen regulatory protein PII